MSLPEDIALWSACRLQQHLHNLDLSPVDVAEACPQQYERHNASVNAIVTLNENVLDDARALERQRPNGLLYGLPVGASRLQLKHADYGPLTAR